MTMKKIITALLLTAVALAFGGCYEKFDIPKEEKVWTDEDFDPALYKMISIAELKSKLSQTDFGGQLVLEKEDGKDLVIRGRVISNDDAGNVFKSMYLYDEQSESAIEVKLFQNFSLFYAPGRTVYVILTDLTLGNYREMVSLGAASRNGDYANGNLEDMNLVDLHIKNGVQAPLKSTDTLVVNASNYQTLTDASLGRLVRFEGLESLWGTAKWGFRNPFPNYFANATSNTWNLDVDSRVESGEVGFPKVEGIDQPTWAYMAEEYVMDPNTKQISKNLKPTYYYGSAWFGYEGIGSANVTGNYVVRSSGYCKFKWDPIPAAGKKVNITAIYTKFDNNATLDDRAAYQLMLNSVEDVVIVE
jgi:hypothetical protein